MYSGSTAARRRRMLIAAGSDTHPYEVGEHEHEESSSLRRYPEDNGDFHDTHLQRRQHVSDAPEEEPELAENTGPMPSRGLPAPPARSRGGSGRELRRRKNYALVPRSRERGWANLPDEPSSSQELICLRRELRPSEQSRAIDLCITSRSTGDSEILRIDTETALIGRGSQSDVRLMHADVSRRHACVQVLEAGILCYDLGSRTGVQWDGQRWPVGWITTDQAASIGPFEIRLASADDQFGGGAKLEDSGTSLKRLPPPVLADPMLETMGFEIINGKSSPAAFLPLRASVTLLGRGSQCAMRIKDERISRVHSSVMAASDGVWLMDLAGRGGVRVNGSRIEHARLEPGDEVQVGRHRMRFLIDQPRVAAEPVEAPAEEPPREWVERPRGEGFVSESLVLAMVETFADMQRQMQEQFSVQMNVMVEMVESLRQESRDEVRAELVRLKSLGEEIRETQSTLARQRLPHSDRGDAPVESPTGHQTDDDRSPPKAPDSAPRRPDARPRSAPQRPEHFGRKPEQEPRKPHRGARDLDGIADHAVVSRRLRELEEERDSSWQKLMRLIRPGH